MSYFKTSLLKPIFFSLLVVGIILFFSSCSIKLRDSSLKEPQIDEAPLRVLSYNIRIAHPPSKGWSEVDLPAIASVIKKAKPDLVALQEVDAFTERSGKTVHQARELAKMTGMDFFFAKAIDRSEGDYGVAVLSRFPIVESRGYRLPVMDSVKSEIRALAVVKAKLPEDDTIVFCSAHFDHLSDDDRLLQAGTMIDILENYSDFPVIIGADFNMEPNNPVIDTIQQALTVDVESYPLTFPAINPRVTIDYVFLNRAANEKFGIVKYSTINEKYASDHLPVEVVLKIK